MYERARCSGILLMHLPAARLKFLCIPILQVIDASPVGLQAGGRPASCTAGQGAASCTVWSAVLGKNETCGLSIYTISTWLEI